MIKCEETATKSEETIAELVRVWESSVRATHLFLFSTSNKINDFNNFIQSTEQNSNFNKFVQRNG